MIDYKKETLNLIETEFPDMKIKCCFFHVTMCLALNPRI